MCYRVIALLLYDYCCLTTLLRFMKVRTVKCDASLVLDSKGLGDWLPFGSDPTRHNYDDISPPHITACAEVKRKRCFMHLPKTEPKPLLLRWSNISVAWSSENNYTDFIC